MDAAKAKKKAPGRSSGPAIPTPAIPDLAILADVGGTNARFALVDESGTGPVTRLAVADYKDPASAIAAFLESVAPDRAPRRAALAIAGPVSNNCVRLTNSNWEFDAAALADTLRLDSVLLKNDFEAVAWGLPSLSASDVRTIGNGSGRIGETIAVIGPGTGLGVAGFLPNTTGRKDAGPGSNSGMRVLVTEGGHVTLPAVDEREAEIVAWLRRQHGHVSAERALSGEGLVNLYDALAAIDAVRVPSRSASEITSHALAGNCSHCLATLDTFCAFLGSVAGNLALSLGARGGVYIAGGIVPRFAGYFAASRFRERFLAKGRFRGYLDEVPTQLIVHPHPAFLGLANCLGTQ